MAMLAAPRRKQKFSMDPRGSSWSQDENKFGQKMLEKMGWSKGRGLGANEDGRTEHVKISHKDDNRGVGCSKSQADNWIAHQDDFNSLLANLNQNYVSNDDSADKETKVLSLEEKSKSSRGRVHYQKFTKGKDLSSRKMEDLDCIFGRRKKRKSSKKEKPAEDEAQICPDSTTTSQLVQCGVQTFDSSDSIQGYFARKMAKLDSSKRAELEKPAPEACPDETTKEEEGASVEEHGGLGLGLKTFSSSQNVQDYFAQKMARLMNGRKVSETKQTDNVQTDTSITPVNQSEPCILADVGKEGNDQSKRKKKKKHKKRKQETCELNVGETGTQEHLEENIVETNKSKRKITEDCEETMQQPSCRAMSDDKETKQNKKRKKDKKKSVQDDGSLEKSVTAKVLEGETPVTVEKSTPNTAEVDTPSRKRVRFSHPVTSVLGEEIATHTSNTDEVTETVSRNLPAEVPNDNLSNENECAETTESTKRKKRKKSKKKNKLREVKVNSDGTQSEGVKTDAHTLTCEQVRRPGDRQEVRVVRVEDKDKVQVIKPGKKKWKIKDRKYYIKVGLKEVKNKRQKHIMAAVGMSADLRTSFVGSNIGQIGGYSNPNPLLAVGSS